jgi:lysozyme family protein
MTIFERALDYVFENEGGFSNDLEDHGGPTKFGITISELRGWRRKPVSIKDVRNMNIDEAKAIYKSKYWDTMDLDQIIHPGSAIAMFDIGIVRGVGIPPKYAQRICNNHGSSLLVDGFIGPLTIAAINELEQALFVREFSSMSRAGFSSIVANNPNQSVFERGWRNRAQRLLTLADIA